MTRLVSELRRALAALGPELSLTAVEGTRALFVPIALRPDPAFCKIKRDVAYGSHARHRLDLFMPTGAASRRPMTVYVHGGGFSGGSKGTVDDIFFNNIGAWATQCGFVGITMNYRLAPEARWPSGAEDVATVVEWLRSNATELGGDPDRIVLMGHSAGAVHVADYLTQLTNTSRRLVAGAVLMSGIYDLTRHQRLGFEQDYYGSNPEQYSMLGRLVKQKVPCLFTVSEFDPPSFQRQAGYLVEEQLLASGRWPRVLYLSGHNHFSPPLSLGSKADTISTELATLVDTR